MDNTETADKHTNQITRVVVDLEAALRHAEQIRQAHAKYGCHCAVCDDRVAFVVTPLCA